ncbi:tetratricopeptide repeat protein [Phyllobacterium sp. OV277]|uniref:tetratricopeptide repeat protein n=1 Tax=Phyllobacterium sp. OV277 TaxID=1882772 RepID=UPI0015872BA6|nr:tetratricopeptide repeat protein [Phyllobacterium sp. OV277]
MTFTSNSHGIVSQYLNNPDRQIMELDKAIALQPDDPFLYYNRAVFYGQKGDIDQAIGDFNEAIRLKPDFAEALGMFEAIQKSRNP